MVRIDFGGWTYFGIWNGYFWAGTDIVPLRPGLYFHIQDLPPGGSGEREDRKHHPSITFLGFFSSGKGGYSQNEIKLFSDWMDYLIGCKQMNKQTKRKGEVSN